VLFAVILSFIVLLYFTEVLRLLFVEIDITQVTESLGQALGSKKKAVISIYLKKSMLNIEVK
jgi:hypothetical protein